MADYESRRELTLDDMRQNPDELLKVATEEAMRSSRGQLKIFFGACAGVGKTYAMLQAAAQRQAEGISVGVGIVETHERVETRRLLEGLPALPLNCRITSRSEGRPSRGSSE